MSTPETTPNGETTPIAWHRLLGEVLEKLLTPVDLFVYTELPVMNKPPKADILLIKRHPQTPWTAPQRERLPDGVRDSQASHLLLEFKYTESLSAKASQQALAYDFFYKEVRNLTATDVQTVLLCAKQPQASHLAELGYVKTALPGVYQSDWPSWLPQVMLLSLNELSDAPHNAFVKCFASQTKQRQKAFEVLWQRLPSLGNLPKSLIWLFTTLWKLWFPSLPGGNMKSNMLTVEDLKNLGPHWKKAMLSTLTIEDLLAQLQLKPADVLAQFKPADLLAQIKPADVLAQFKPADLLAQFKPADLLAQIKPADVLAQFKPADLLAQIKPADVLAQFKSKDLLAHFKPEELLALIKPEDLENYYLSQLKKSPRPTKKAKAKSKR